MTATPLLDRIRQRHPDRIGPLCPLPTERLSPFARALVERRLVARDFTWYNGALTPDESGGAA